VDDSSLEGSRAASPLGADAPAPTWIASAARASRVLALLALPGLFLKYAHGNLEVNDFSVYYTAARAVFDGIDPYAIEGPTGRPYVYAPGFAVLLLPLAALPFSAAAVLWSLTSLLAVLASVWLCLDLLGLARSPLAWTVGGLALAASGRMLDSELGNGQANHWVLLSLTACTWLLARGRSTLAGVALSVGIVAKVTPLLALAYLAARRQWRACAGAAAGLLLFAGLLPALAMGPREAVEANRVWAGRVLAPALRVAPRSAEAVPARPRRVHGYSLRALTHRWLTRSQAAAHHPEPVFVNLVAATPRTAEAVYRGLALLALLTAALALGARPPPDAQRWLLEMSIVAATMVLIAPLSRKAHFVVLLLPFVVGVAQAVERSGRDARLWVLPPALVFVFTSPGAIGKHAAALVLAWGAYTLATLWLWAGALLAARRAARPRLG
jgi:hypothetical protein